MQIKSKYKTIKLQKLEDKNIYYEKEDLLKMGYENCNIERMKKFIQFYKYKTKLYVLKDDIKQLNIWKSKLGSLKNLIDEFGIYNETTIRKKLKNENIVFLNIAEQPFCSNAMYYLEDYDKIKKIILKDIPPDINDEKKFLTIQQANKLLGEEMSLDNVHKAFEFKIKYKNSIYIKTEEVEVYKNIKANYISLNDFINNFSLESGIRIESIRNKINLFKTKNIITLIKKHPFKGIQYLISKLDANKIKEHMYYNKKIESATTIIQLYKIYSEKILVKDNLNETISLYDKFVITRCKAIKNKRVKYMANIFATVRQILIMNFKMEIYKYKEEVLRKIIENIVLNEEYSQQKKIEFIAFINYLREHEIISSNIEYNLTKRQFAKNKEVLAYTQEEYFEVFKLLYVNLDNNLYRNKIIENHKFAQIWLYMFLHYITIWRRGDICNISSPLLKYIGFTGKTFLEYLKRGCEFTEEMGITIVELVKKKLNICKIKASKNNQNLFIETGLLLDKPLGLLIAICEAHREISYEKNPNTKESKYLICESTIKRKEYYERLFGDDLKNILGTNIFLNTRANKSYNNYIQNYHEENGYTHGSTLFSIMRGHVLNTQNISETSVVYETRKVDKTLQNAVAILFNRGSFAFVKYQILDIMDSNFINKSSEEKTAKINEIELTPYEIEYTMKNILIQREKVDNLISKMMISPNMINQIIIEIANGETYSKHNYARCLLKAILNSIPSTDEKISYDILQVEVSKNCIMDNFESCIGCPYLIEEMYFLYELNDLIFDAISNLENCKSSYDKYMYTQLIFNKYIPILKEAQIVLGKTIVNQFINIKEINKNLHILGEKNLICLNY